MGKTVKDILKKPSLLFMTLGHRGFFNWMEDELYLRIAFRIATGERLNLDNPRTFNEKLQWLKLNDRKAEYSKMVDKYEAKKYVAEVLGEEYIIPTLGVWDHFDDINFDALPDQFVLKCTHDSGGLVICKDKSKLDKKKSRRKIEKCLCHNYYWGQREWPYKNVKPRIIAEKYMTNSSGEQLKDYKFLVFDGTVKALFVASDRGNEGVETRFDFFNDKGEFLPFSNGRPHADAVPPMPHNFEEMKRIASKLGEGIPHVRIDFYEVDGRVYFGEITFYWRSGMIPFDPRKWDYIFGEWINISLED